MNPTTPRLRRTGKKTFLYIAGITLLGINSISFTMSRELKEALYTTITNADLDGLNKILQNGQSLDQDGKLNKELLNKEIDTSELLYPFYCGSVSTLARMSFLEAKSFTVENKKRKNVLDQIKNFEALSGKFSKPINKQARELDKEVYNYYGSKFCLESLKTLDPKYLCEQKNEIKLLGDYIDSLDETNCQFILEVIETRLDGSFKSTKEKIQQYIEEKEKK